MQIGTRTLPLRKLDEDVVLGSRVTSEPPPEKPLATAVAFCFVPSETAFTKADLENAESVIVAAVTERTLLRVEIYRGSELTVASDGAAAQHNLLVTASSPWPKIPDSKDKDAASKDARVFVVVSRVDAGRAEAKFTASVHRDTLTHDPKFAGGKNWFVGSLSAGNAFLYAVDVTAYDGLLAFARCDWVSYEARHKPATTTPTNTTAGCLATQMTALRERIYPFVSQLTGRVSGREFVEGQPRAALSEPMVVFFGLGGANRVLLLDCRDTAGGGDTRRCDKFAEPWQTTLQRARYVWGVYIEDEQTPFNTSIDVEFKARAPSVDYEEYDPRGLITATVAAKSSGATRLLRIGYRRFRVREPPVAAQVAFSRQGPNYGLRQWTRVFRQFSTRWWVLSGAVFVPAANNSVTHVELESLPPTDGIPARAQIVADDPPAPVFATLVWRWPQVRGLAENKPTTFSRLLVNLIPDIAGGLSLPTRRHNSYFVGGSWPILADRLSFIAGVKIYRDDQPAEGFAIRQVVPATVTVDVVRGRSEHHADFLFGLAVELVRSR
jgi:hypothetical protein